MIPKHIEIYMRNQLMAFVLSIVGMISTLSLGWYLGLDKYVPVDGFTMMNIFIWILLKDGIERMFGKYGTNKR